MIGIIIQAREGSKRLPNKMTMPFFEGKGMLESLIIRLKKSNLDIPIIIATTNHPLDDIIFEIGRNHNLYVYRGSNDNVLHRYINAAKQLKITKIIRICADNPFLDINSLKNQIKNYTKVPVDYWCFSLKDKTPSILTHYGFWGEGVSIDALINISNITIDPIFLEHVTNFIYNNPNLFSIHYEIIDPEIESATGIRLTVDTKIDIEIAKEIYKEIESKNIPFTAQEIIKKVKTNSKWGTLMNEQISYNLKSS